MFFGQFFKSVKNKIKLALVIGNGWYLDNLTQSPQFKRLDSSQRSLKGV